MGSHTASEDHHRIRTHCLLALDNWTGGRSFWSEGNNLDMILAHGRSAPASTMHTSLSHTPFDMPQVFDSSVHESTAAVVLTVILVDSTTRGVLVEEVEEVIE